MGNVLRGQNLRVLSYDSTTEKMQVFALATSCVITTTNNTESNKTKDDVGLADKPEVVSRAGTIQVDTLNVLDAAAILTAIRTFKIFRLIWDEVSTTNNQTVVNASSGSFARMCDCLCNDLSLTFNDREISAKSVQFIMNTEPVVTVSTHYDQVIIGDTAKTRGQFVRLLLGADGTTAPTKVIAWARQLTLHVSVQLESVHTKDDEGSWDPQEAVGLTYDISTTALVKGNSDNITSQVEGQELADTDTIQASAIPVKWRIANMSGANQRTMGAVIASGLVQITQIQRNAAVGNVAEYTTQLNGYGDYTVGS